MTPQLFGILGIASLVILIFLRIPVGISLIAVGFVGYVSIEGWQHASTILGTAPFNIAGGYNLSVVPLFVLMGEIASISGMSSRLFDGARAIFGKMKGSLAYATIGANAGFGAVCGSSVASAATMTRICVPEMQHHGYDDRLATGSVAAGGTLGILIPPSLILVIYAVIAQESVARLFAAGLLPGIVLTGLYMLVVTAMVTFFPDLAPENQKQTLSQRFRQLAGMWEFGLLFFISVGGIYAGFFSPTEAASIGAFMAIVIGFATKHLNWQKLVRSIIITLRTSAMLFMIIIGAYVFSYFVVQARLPDALIGWIDTMGMGPIGLMVTLIIAYLILGCFLEGIGLVLITVPVFLPVVVAHGYDPVWFGIIVVIAVEMGLINPPVGMNLFVIQAQLPETPILSIYTGTIPFLIAPLVLVVILIAFPSLALYLPHLFFG